MGLLGLGADPDVVAASMIGALCNLEDAAVGPYAHHVPLLADPAARVELTNAALQLQTLLNTAADAKRILQQTTPLTFPTLPLADTWEASLNNLLGSSCELRDNGAGGAGGAASDQSSCPPGALGMAGTLALTKPDTGLPRHRRPTGAASDKVGCAQCFA